MRRFFPAVFLTLLAAFSAAAGMARAQFDPVAPAPWVTGYYPGWTMDSLPPGEIDFTALTHLIQFSVKPRVDGTLDWSTHELGDAHVSAAVAAAHAAKKSILLCVGGADTAPGFRAALQPALRPVFIQRLADAVKTHGYDGLDVDMEPMQAGDEALFVPFIRELRAELRRRDPRTLLTAAVGELPALFAGLQDQFDQINFMAYDLSGPWEDWVTWHNAALQNTALRFPTVDRLLPSVDGKVRQWLAAGVAPAKLGLGMPFYGYAWRGAAGPNQGIKGVTYRQLPYRDIAATWLRPERFHWDEAAAVPFLRVEAAGKEPAVFVSYDDERSLRLKVGYLRRMKLGGAMLWELDSGHLPKSPPGQRDPLLRAVHEAMISRSP